MIGEGKRESLLTQPGSKQLLRRFDFCVVDPREVFIVKGYPLFMIKNEWFRVTRKAQATVATK